MRQKRKSAIRYILESIKRVLHLVDDNFLEISYYIQEKRGKTKQVPPRTPSHLVVQTIINPPALISRRGTRARSANRHPICRSEPEQIKKTTAPFESQRSRFFLGGGAVAVIIPAGAVWGLAFAPGRLHAEHALHMPRLAQAKRLLSHFGTKIQAGRREGGERRGRGAEGGRARRVEREGREGRAAS